MKTTGVFGSVGGTLFGPLQGGKLEEVEEEALPSKPVFFDAIEFLPKSPKSPLLLTACKIFASPTIDKEKQLNQF